MTNMENLERRRWLYPGLVFVMFSVTSTAGLWSLFYPHIMKQFGLSVVAPVALAASLMSVGSMVVGPPVAGMLFDRYGPKLALGICGVLFAAGMAVISMMAGLKDWSIAKYYWYLGSVLVALGAGMFSGACRPALARWFPERFGTIMGIVGLAQGIGGVVTTQLVALLLANYGWVKTFLVPGVSALFLYSALGIALWTVPPPDWKPSGWQPKRDAGKGAPKEHYALGEAAKDVRFWILYVCFLCAAFANQLFVQNASMIIIEGLTKGGMNKGYVVATIVPLFLSMVAFVRAAGALGWGTIMDKLGGPWRTLPIVYFMSGALIGVFYLGYTSLVWVFAAGAVMQFTLAGAPTAHYAAVPYLFGTKHLGTVMNVLNAFSVGLGIVLGPYLGAFIRDVTGTYKWSLALSVTLEMVATLVALYGGRLARKQLASG